MVPEYPATPSLDRWRLAEFNRRQLCDSHGLLLLRFVNWPAKFKDDHAFVSPIELQNTPSQSPREMVISPQVPPLLRVEWRHHN